MDMHHIIEYKHFFMHEICSDRVNLKDFSNYLCLFTSNAESRTSRVRRQCGRPGDHRPITHQPLLSEQYIARLGMSVLKHSVSSA